jgi:1-acyl-sn-glycerol-3-phosphate acyltransferase
LSCKYRVLYKLVCSYYAIFSRLRVIGRENVPRSGPVIIVANHLAMADPPLLAVCLGRRVNFMAKQQLFRFPGFRWLLRRLGAFPVYRGRLDMASMRWVHGVLKKGGAVVIFPEGMRSRDGKLHPAYRGVAAIAARAKAPVLPVGIIGTEKLERPWRFGLRPEITVRVGEPFILSRDGHKPGRHELAELTTGMMENIARLLPPEYRGKYPL